LRTHVLIIRQNHFLASCIAPIVHPKLNTAKEPFKCGMRSNLISVIARHRALPIPSSLRNAACFFTFTGDVVPPADFRWSFAVSRLGIFALNPLPLRYLNCAGIINLLASPHSNEIKL